MPVGADAPIATLVAADTTICPPCAAEHTRAVVCTARPMYPRSVRVGRPLWIPTRTRTSVDVGGAREGPPPPPPPAPPPPRRGAPAGAGRSAPGRAARAGPRPPGP